ncbi:MAG: alpha-glucosidase/alpha-galactosidase [Clostridia bacterium]|nr:alpha-glucosidase/alpha-galactosidase [Clostridia bacterium]
MQQKPRYNFAFIGAGSTVFTVGLVCDILHNPDILPAGELRLVDVDPVALEEAYGAVSALIRTSGRDFTVTKHTDFRETLPGLDFIFFTFVTGGYASWKVDIDICMRHGVMHSVGDTIGPGGIIRTLRNVPVVVEIAREMERVCPDAWAINYSNPEGALCLALEKYTKIRTFGLCHGTPGTARELAEHVFGVEPGRITFRAAGINHLTWITQLEIDGRDVYSELGEKLVASGYNKKQPISYQLYKYFGLYPCPGDRHVGEFFSSFVKENTDLSGRDEGRETSKKRLARIINGELGYKDFGSSGETSLHFIRALLGGARAYEMANVQNRGYIENVSDGTIVEVPVFVDGFGLHPQHIGMLPAGIAAKCEALGREYALAVDAAVTGDKQLALQAMLMDPLAAHCSDPEKLLDELLEAYKGTLVMN